MIAKRSEIIDLLVKMVERGATPLEMERAVDFSKDILYLEQKYISLEVDKLEKKYYSGDSSECVK